MTNNNFFHRLIKVFSMKNDTFEEAQKRYKRSLICIPFSLIPTLFLIFLQDAKMSSFTEYFLFGIYLLCTLTPFIAMSSLIAPLKAAFNFEKCIFGHSWSISLVLVFPMLIVFGALSFVFIIMSAFSAPIFLTLYGVYKSKKNLDDFGGLWIPYAV